MHGARDARCCHCCWDKKRPWQCLRQGQPCHSSGCAHKCSPNGARGRGHHGPCWEGLQRAVRGKPPPMVRWPCFSQGTQPRARGQSLGVLQQPHCPLSRVQSWQVSMSKHPRTEQPGLVFWQMTWIAELSSCSEGISPVFSLHLTWNRVSLVSPIPKLTFDTCQLDLPAGPFVCWQ